jgi:phage terminase large subunit
VQLQALFDQLNRVGLPYRPRDYQAPFWEAMVLGQKKRANLVWHRRAGKDTTALTYLLWEAARVAGTYYYLFPTYNQGKKVLWDGQTSRGMDDDRASGNVDGVPFKTFVPRSWLDTTKGSGGTGFIEDEMQIWLRNGSLIQVVGTDKLDNVRGANVRGAVFSEYSVSKPESWTHLIEPMLLENGGWAVFVYTPQGQNHAYKLHNHASGDPDWFSSLLTIRETRRPDGTPVIDPADVEKRVADGRLDRETADQEYYCSFLGAIAGAYYATQMRWLAQNGRIGRVPWDARLPVATWWDLGYDDSTTIWFIQRNVSEVRLIDYEEHSGEGLPYYSKLCQEKPYTYSHHVMPHDVEVHELGSGITRRETAIKLGLKPIVTCERHRVHDGIDAVRGLLQRCWFDASSCERGLQSLREYRKEYDADKFVYKKTPRHDQWSHGADAFRTGAKGDSRTPITDHKQQFADGDFDPRTYLKDRQYDDFDPRGVTTWR